MPLKWTNRSRPPSSGVMKPKPLSSLNHLTVPVPITAIPTCALSGWDRPSPVRRNLSRRKWRLQPLGSASLEGGLAGSRFQERADGALEVLGVEQGAGDLGHERVGPRDPALERGADDALGRRVGDRRAVGEVAYVRAHGVLEAVVGEDAVDDVPALERVGAIQRAGVDELAGAR